MKKFLFGLYCGGGLVMGTLGTMFEAPLSRILWVMVMWPFEIVKLFIEVSKLG